MDPNYQPNPNPQQVAQPSFDTTQNPQIITPSPAPDYSQLPQSQPQNNTQFMPTNGLPVMPATNVAPPNLGTAPSTVVTGSSNKKPKFLLIIGVAVGLLVAITVLALLMAPKKKTTQKASTTKTTNITESNGPQPASALDVEQSNNSINQDISNPNDDNDFPINQLDDKSIGL